MEKWIDLSMRSQAETQELINQELGRDFKSFIQTDFFGQGREKSFMSLTPAHQVELLEQILPIEELSQWVKYAKGKQKDLKDDISGVEGELQYLIGSLHQVNTFIKDLDEKRAEFVVTREQSMTDLAGQLQEYDDSVADVERRLQIVQTGLDAIVEPSSTFVEGSRTNYDMIGEDIKKAKANESLCMVTHRQLKVKEESMRMKLVDLDGNCPTCNQPLPEDTRNDLIIEQHDVRGILAQTEKDLQHVKVTLDGWAHHISDLEGRQRAAKETYDDVVNILNQKNTLLAEKKELEEQLDPNKRSVLRCALADWQSATNPHDQDLRNKRHERGTLEVSKRCLEEKLSKLNEEYEHLSFWVDTFGKSFKNFLFNRACPFLQSRASHHLNELGNGQLKVDFSTSKTLKSGDEKSGLSVHAYSEKGGNGYDNLSGGEQQMVSFAVGLALADLAETQVQGPSHFLILDEPFMALDERNCENLVNYMAGELSYRRETILLISNEDVLKSLIPERIHVEKTGGITRVKT
jgi:DNA repair exonuclease SbcCD ATPase subunit